MTTHTELPRLRVHGRLPMPLRTRLPAAPVDQAAHRITLTAMGVLSFLVGFTAFYKVRFFGELYVAEILLPFFALATLFAKRRENYLSTPLFRALAVTSILVVVGYVISDVVRDTAIQDATRGWGRALLVATSFISLVAIAAQDRRNLWWFVLGFGLGGVLYLRFGVNLSFTVWKHGLGVDRGYALYMVPLCAALAWFVPMRLAAIGFVFLAGYSANYDFRTFSIICVVVAGMLWIRGGDVPGKVRRINAGTLAAGIAAALVVVIAVYAALSHRGDEVSTRRAASNDGRLAGLLLGARAIVVSPVVGWGSWSQSAELQEIKRELEREGGAAAVLADRAAATGAIHAQLPQAWAEGGIIAAAFFLILFVEGLRRLPYGVLSRPLDPLTPVLLYFLVHGQLNLWGAPFAAPMRLDLAFMAVALAVIAGDATAGRKGSSLPGRPHAMAVRTRKHADGPQRLDTFRRAP